MTTPIIHPINEKKPEFPCWIGGRTQMSWYVDRPARLSSDALQPGSVWTHWSKEDFELPPEVTPEQGKELAKLQGLYDRCSADWRKYRLALNQIAHPSSYGTENADPREIARCAVLMGMTVDPFRNDAPVSGPSPAAKDAANDIACKLVGGDYSLDEARALCAAIIDRKFPREEDTEHVLRCVRDYIKAVPCSCEFNGEGVPKFTCWKHVFEYNMGFVDSARAALQDSREGSK